MFPDFSSIVERQSAIAKAIDDSVSAFDFSPLPIAYSYSDTQFEIIKRHILEFQASLDPEHDIGLLLTNFGQTVVMEVTEIGYEQSVLMVFRGYVNGRMSTLIQHVSQLNFLLTTVPKEPDAPKRQIGFSVPPVSE